MEILLTGYNGFLGKVIYKNLIKNRHRVWKAGRGQDADVKLDLVCTSMVLPKVEMIVHCAGKAHLVPKNPKENNSFLEINFNGTKNICDALERNCAFPDLFIFISSVAVYGLDKGVDISENTPLNGVSPYAISKINAENYLLHWGKRNDVKVLILRLPLIVGDNPPGNLKKMLNGIKNGTYFSIAGGKAQKSMVLAEDIAELINSKPVNGGVYNLTDGCHPTFRDMELLISGDFGKRLPIKVPTFIAKLVGFFGDFVYLFPINTSILNKLTSDLTFSDLKAKKELNWKPRSVIKYWNPNNLY
jgi:nucleoside-diphosphate-sugar epimerase